MKRFNWVDYTILGILLLAVGLLAFKFFEKSGDDSVIGGTGEEKMMMSIEVLCADMDLTTAQAVKAGLTEAPKTYSGKEVSANRLFNSGIVLDGEIVDCKFGEEKEDGTVDVLLTIEAKVNYEAGSYSLGYQQIRIGKEYIAKTMNIELNGIINGFALLDEN